MGGVKLVSLLKKIFNRSKDECLETRELSSDYLDGGLAPQKRSRVQAHLSRCGPCRAFVDTLASTIGILARFQRVSPPANFKQSIIERVKKDEQG